MTCGHVIAKSLEKDYIVVVTFSTGYISEDFRVVTTTKEAEKEVGLLFGCDEGLKGDAYKSFSSVEEYSCTLLRVIYLVTFMLIIHVSGHGENNEIKILKNMKKIMKYMIRDEEYEMDDEIMLGHGEGVVKFGIPISHIKQVISEFHNRIYPSCDEEGLNCLFLHFKEEEERKRTKKQEMKRKRQEKREKRERRRESGSWYLPVVVEEDGKDS